MIRPQSSPTRSPAADGMLGQGIRAPERVLAPAHPEQGVAELGLEGEVELGRRDERGGTLVQAHGRAVVLAAGRAMASRPSAAASRRRPARRRRAARARPGNCKACPRW